VERSANTDPGRAAPHALPIVQYWHAEQPPDYIADLLQTFSDLNPDRRHRVFSAAEAEELIAERFTARELSAFRACAAPAMQADYFRYCAVLALGGIYSDADFRCVAALAPLIPAAGRGRLFRGPKGNVINGLFAFGSPGHPFLELALEVATANIERRLSDHVYFLTGPPIFMALTGLRRCGSFDALIAQTAGSKFERFVKAYCETIGDYGRVSHALEGIRVGATGEHDAFVAPPGIDLPYKSSDAHWTRARVGG
jgi:Glycosyltransferase sugar-binding region containing DXD motif